MRELIERGTAGAGNPLRRQGRLRWDRQVPGINLRRRDQPQSSFSSVARLGSDRFRIRRCRRLQPGAVRPAIEIFDDFGVARPPRFGRPWLFGKLARQLDGFCHSQTPNLETCVRRHLESTINLLFLLNVLLMGAFRRSDPVGDAPGRANIPAMPRPPRRRSRTDRTSPWS